MFILNAVKLIKKIVLLTDEILKHVRWLKLTWAPVFKSWQWQNNPWKTLKKDWNHDDTNKLWIIIVEVRMFDESIFFFFYTWSEGSVWSSKMRRQIFFSLQLTAECQCLFLWQQTEKWPSRQSTAHISGACFYWFFWHLVLNFDQIKFPFRLSKHILLV